MAFGELIIMGFAGTISEAGAQGLAAMLRKIKPDATRHDTLKSLYVPVDTVLENYAQETKSKVDDVFTLALKRAIEIVAAEDMITLPNVDGD